MAIKIVLALAMTGLSLAALPAAQEKRLVVVSDVIDPVSLDPHREFDASSENIINHIYDGLLRMDVQGQIHPALAESWTRIDERTVEFYLRKNVIFHNGEPFTAEAVRFSLMRQLDPKQPAPNAGMVDTIEEAVVVDSYTVRLKTKVPDGVLLNKLSLFVRVLPPRYLRETGDPGFAAAPVGTGPFIFDRWIPGDRIELVANPHYWAPSQPKVERLVFRFLSTDKQLDAFLNNNVDIITDLSGLDTMRVVKNLDAKIVKAKNFYTVSLLINSRKKPFADQRLREALAGAVDRRALVRYGAKGNAVALDALTMPGEFGHNPGIRAAPYDPARSRRLIEEAGYQNFKVKVLVREEVKNFASVILAQLKKVGIETDYVIASQKEIFEKIVLPNINPDLPPWDGDLVITHYVDPTAHVYFPYSILVYSKGGYSLTQDEEFDQAFLAMTHELNPEKQLILCHRLEEINRRKILALSFVQVIRPFAMRKTVSYEPQITGMLDFRNATKEDEKNGD
ncbi:MAG: ABC transporter substrate-binding protein [Elusimicrobia bacterium]|nr:ABC transporter substrate-binding protein [Elusimicrobiota bacterium]